MPVVRGLALAFVAFVASFALHIVGGATDQGWLFAIAVALIFIAATGFPAIATLLAGPATDIHTRWLLGIGAVAGFVLTMSALWAANDRSTALWHFPAALVLVVVVSGVILAATGRLTFWRASSAAGGAGA